MIPYFELRTIPIAGQLSVAVFGTLVVAGVFAGILFAEARARAVGIPERELYGAIAWAVIPGFILAHLTALLPHREIEAPIAFETWNGMSSFGGFAGALLGLACYYRRASPSFLRVAEILLQALVIGWVFGRLGCTLVHDHIGKPSEFWLAIRFPGGPRHDLGFYELLYTVFVMVPAVIVLDRETRAPGATIACIALLYAPARFFADFLRNADLPGADVRYAGGLTLAQYACLLLAGVGLLFARRSRGHQP